METWYALLNPFAANGKTVRKEVLIKKNLTQAGINFHIETSQSREHAVQLIQQAIENGYRKFIGIGGDGTLNSLVNGIFSQQKISSEEIIVALIPIGTGNDWIKTHHIPKSIPKSIDIIKAGRTVLHDVGIVTKKNENKSEQRYFINVTGFAFEGFVAERIEGTAHWLKIGLAAFYFGLLDALFRYKTTQVQVKVNEKVLEEKYFNISIGICKYAGGGMKLTPDAIMDDGLLEVTLAGNLGKLEVIQNVFRLFNGSFVKHKKISQYRSQKISIASSPMIPIETDGEVFGYGDASVEILQRAIQVVIP